MPNYKKRNTWIYLKKRKRKRSLQDAIAFTGAVQRIAKAKQCKISPLTIQAIKDDNNYFVHLDMEFTVYNIQTTPFYDLKVRHLIAEGKEHPKYTQISQDDLQRLDTGRKNILKDSSLYAKATDKIRLLVNDSCNHAICLQLLGKHRITLIIILISTTLISVNIQ